jgi:hypothetical protein
MIQQLQFLRAVVIVSGARLIVSERAGLADLVALAGGIPECQFIARGARLGNHRLTEVYESGCGMGHNVIFDDGFSKNVEVMELACVRAIADKVALNDALEKFKSKLALQKQPTTSAMAACSGDPDDG